ncbi:type I restriction endonuclease subunit S [Ligilactobacillus murinus]|uniref:Type I restriction modification DNA specificity domain-containing protein n=1 Tax=Ligilactobacillus murinus TaxID=1622 RepID=A0AAD0L375_9LACO|nr:restriction endonuclease subunit S [Ligilactobacillus murinus]AWZ37840.1 hypothetical protein CPS94_02340 [Ligilactobacillus murinus]BDI01650.1 type I restriction endonuclease subunit S [Ligilactobacillus murinus]GFI63005.1 type-1 restriction enzyme EcoKI specificity protein [Lactobacillaceae bacterium]
MIFGRHELYLYFETRAYSLHYEKFADGTVNPLLTTLDFPDNWLPIKLSQILRVSSGKSLKRTQLTEDGNVPVYGAHGIMGSYSEGFIEKGTLLIGRVGFYAGSIMRTKEFSWVTDNSLIVSSSSVVNSNFLELSLKHLNLGSLTSQTAQPVISGQKIYSQIIFLPPVNEQTKIVDSYNELISKVNTIEKEQEQLKQLATQLKQKVLDVAMQGKLVPQDPNDEPASVLLEKIRAEKQRLYEEGKIKKKDLVETELVKDGDNAYYGKLPKTWIKSKLFSVANVIMGQSPKGNNVTSEFSLNAVEFHQGKSDFGEKFLNPSGKYTSQITKEIEIPSIVMSVRAPVGDVNLTRKTIVIGRGLAAIQPYGYSLEYLYHFLLTQKSILEQQATGTTFKAIGGEVLRNLPIALPAEKEQIRIVNLINSVFEVESQLMK